MVQGTIADKTSEFAIPVTIEVKGRKVHVRGTEGHWTDSVHRVIVEAVTPTVFRFHFEGVDWVFRPDNPLDAHFDLLDPWRAATSARHRRIHIRRAEPEAWNPGRDLVIQHVETGGIEIESVVAPVEHPTFERLPVIDERAHAHEAVASFTEAASTETPTNAAAGEPSVGEVADRAVPDAVGGSDFVGAAQPGLHSATTAHHDSTTFEPQTSRPPAPPVEAHPDAGPEATPALTSNDVAMNDFFPPTTPERASRSSDIEVFIDIDALPRPDARDPFDGDDRAAPSQRTLEETMRADASRPTDDEAPSPAASRGPAGVRERSSSTIRRAGARARTLLRSLRSLMVRLWAATATAIHRAGSQVLGMPAPRLAVPGEVAKGAGPEMCVEVHAWSIASHGLFRVARCIYCDEVRMDSEQSTSDAAPTLRRFGGVRTGDGSAGRPLLTEA
jgi:hypothetical protein